MCQTSVVMKDGSSEVEVLKDVVLVQPDEKGVSIRGFFGESKKFAAKIVKIDLLERKIYLEPLP